MISDSDQTLIKVKNLRKSYQIDENREVEILKGVDFTIDAAEFVIIYGASGSGKSTLLHHLIGLESPSEGQINFLDQEITAMTAEQRAMLRAEKFGMVHQIWYWIKSLTVLENVSVPLLLKGYKQHEANKKALEVLEVIEMAHFKDKSPMQLSGGEQQRVCLARALINNPWVVVADEPTGSLDTHSSDKIMKIFQDLNKINRRTIIMVTHDLSYLPMATKKIPIKDGRVVDESEIAKDQKIKSEKSEEGR